jgi:hypothetical protein
MATPFLDLGSHKKNANQAHRGIFFLVVGIQTKLGEYLYYETFEYKWYTYRDFPFQLSSQNLRYSPSIDEIRVVKRFFPVFTGLTEDS